MDEADWGHRTIKGEDLAMATEGEDLDIATVERSSSCYHCFDSTAYDDRWICYPMELASMDVFTSNVFDDVF